MARDLFNVPIFFIVFRETIEAAIIVSVLLSFVEQLMLTGKLGNGSLPSLNNREDSTLLDSPNGSHSGHGQRNKELSQLQQEEQSGVRVRKLLRRMRIQIWAGTIAGFIIALAIGAAFIAVFYTKLTDLWADTEQIWEGVFSIIAAIVIYIMGIAFLKMDRSRVKWRLKLAEAFDKSQSKAIAREEGKLRGEDAREGRGGKWALFLLPFITVLREGLEAVVFVGGVSLDVEAASIPIPVIIGLICGSIVGYAIYKTGNTATLHWFLIGSTTFLFLIGAGLASKGVGYFEYYHFAKGVGGDVAETGDGPGSFRTKGNVWHLTYGNPETGSPTTNGGWQLFNALFGWNNTATLGSVLIYVFYWIAVIVALIVLKWKEGRVAFLGKSSAAAQRRNEKRPEVAHRSESAVTPGVDDKHLHGGQGGVGGYGEPESPGVEKREGVPTLELRH